MKNTENPGTISLSVIDDHPIVFLGIQMALRNNKFHPVELINHYRSAASLLDDLDNLKSNVLLVDMSLPDMKGYNLTRKILDVFPNMKIGIYSGKLDKSCIQNSFKYGALGYLLKSASADEIVDFILTIARGERYVRGIVADLILSRENFISNQIIITKREKEILQLILDGFKNKKIAENLNIAERTVEFHKQNLYLKLEVNNTIDLYKAAMRHNLIAEID
jgi:two-component system nitrate/nitrite response regulator NarL